MFGSLLDRVLGEHDERLKASLTRIPLWMLALLALDLLIFFRRPSRWFGLHAAANIAITIACAKDVYLVAFDPLSAMDGTLSYSLTPVELIAAIHLYHIVAFRNLTAADIFHHAVFGGVIVTGAYCYNWGRVQNCLAIFLCGIPGAIDYAMLAGVKEGKVDKTTEKKWNSHINVWMRGPGCVICSCLLWLCTASGRSTGSALWAAVAAFLVFFNGQYYSHRVVASWGLTGGRPS